MVVLAPAGDNGQAIVIGDPPPAPRILTMFRCADALCAHPSEIRLATLTGPIASAVAVHPDGRVLVLVPGESANVIAYVVPAPR
jgi:hypothetical protein